MNLLSSASKTLCFLGEIRGIYESVEKIHQPNNLNSELNKFNLTTKTLTLSLNIFEMLAISMGAKTGLLESIKGSEVVVRLLGLPFRVIEEIEEGNSTLECIERSVVPVSGLVKAVAAATIYQEKGYLELVKDDPQAKRPIYEYDYEEERKKIIGYREVNVEECEQNIASAKDMEQAAGFVELVACGRILSRNFSDLYQQIIIGGVAPAGVVVREGLAAAMLPADPLNLLDHSVIPLALHDDSVFAKYICPISFCPIRYPVADPNGITLYERAEIIKWINAHHNSPVTHLPLAIGQLQPRPALQALINHRLQFYQDQFTAIAAAQVHTPANPVIMDAAIVENPTY